MRHVQLGLLLMAACLALLAPAASAFVARTPSGHRVSLMRRGPLRANRGGGGGGGVLVSRGGPVLSAEAPYLIFWDPTHAIPAASEGLLDQYLTDVAAASGSTTDVYSVLSFVG
jgi:hypothetical protein